LRGCLLSAKAQNLVVRAGSDASFLGFTPAPCYSCCAVAEVR
jgi:hypothetical protein